ncbi:nicotinamide riboside kinase 2-like [Bicyclus anynana]|uniref:Nicotinamide riboside kinase 2-like n=1 Tax=Bicyclus anynana TaxID=110368 RepID=A0ABM3M023_BICAN|nr:nicotinamide riboside kinase 2-like [Bicyclus anynana]XP_052744666.1 nicotinamide riboside kinase 2-like [Bicyclus anynana]
MSLAKRDEWIIIGISGVTCGGKTTLANKLLDILSPVYIFHQDQYFYPDDSPHHIKCHNLDHNNYDILSSLNMSLMYDDIVSTINGDNKSQDHNLDRSHGKIEVKGKKFMIVEGFTVINYKPIMEICHLRYFFVLDYATCLNRRVYRLYDPPDIDGYFDQCVWPEHLKYRAEVEKDKRITILDGTRHDSLETVLSNLASMGSSKVL